MAQRPVEGRNRCRNPTEPHPAHPRICEGHGGRRDCGAARGRNLGGHIPQRDRKTQRRGIARLGSQASVADRKFRTRRGEGVSGAQRWGTVLRSNYSDGSSKFTLLLQRPAPELETYLSDSGITGVTSVHDASCGTFEQAQKPVCARVIDKTVIMVMGFSDQDNETLANLIESVYNAVKNQ